MIRTLAIASLLALGLTGCKTNSFQQNLEADNNSTSIQTLSEKQNQQVDEFSQSGQLNSYEEAQMKESIGADGVSAPDPGGYLEQ